MYNKLFTSILDSSIWLESCPTRVVWVMFLAAMDEDGFVRMASVANVSNRARVTLEEAKTAVETLEGPDAVSPDQDFQGRRIERVEGGWLILNAKKYREIVSRESQREKTRLRVAKFRASKTKPPENSGVTVCNENVTTSEAEAEAYKKGVRAREEIASVAELTQGLASKLFHRQEGQRPTYAEESLATAILARNSWQSERDEILSFHAKLTGDAKRFAGFPKCLCDLLQSWTETLDKARTFDPKAYEPKATIQPRAQHFDRNKGTANEGTAHLYQVKKPVKTAV